MKYQIARKDKYDPGSEDGVKDVFSTKKEGDDSFYEKKIRENLDFFRLKKGSEDFFSEKSFPKHGLRTR